MEEVRRDPMDNRTEVGGGAPLKERPSLYAANTPLSAPSNTPKPKEIRSYSHEGRVDYRHFGINE